jgi:hypothetical protein
MKTSGMNSTHSRSLMIVIRCVFLGTILIAAALLSNAANEVAPVTVKVVDAANGVTVTNFSYAWWVAAPGQEQATAHEGVSSNGQFCSMAQEQCAA